MDSRRRVEGEEESERRGGRRRWKRKDILGAEDSRQFTCTALLFEGDYYLRVATIQCDSIYLRKCCACVCMYIYILCIH